MKKLAINLLTFLLLLLGASLHAQQSWQWGQRVGVQTEDIAVDNHGNTYVLWSLMNGYTIDGNAISGYGQSDIALTSFSCDGTYRWTKVVGTSSYDGGAGSVKTDTLGGVYIWSGVASNGSNPIYVGNDTTIAATTQTMILLKYDTSGNFKWVRMPEPDTLTYSSTTKGMDVAANGDCYLYGLLSPGSYGNGAYIATFPYSYYGNRGSGIYALKYDRNGNCTGGVHFDMYYSGASFTYTAFKRDPLTKQYYLSGWLSSGTDTLKFGSNMASKAMYIACFDSTGNARWLQQSANIEYGSEKLVKPEVDNQGNIYITGGIFFPDTMAGWSLSNIFGTNTFPFLLKLDPTDGHAIWGTNASTTGASWGVAVNVTNNATGVTGDYGMKITWDNLGAENTAAHNEDYNVFLARFNATTGAVVGFDTLSSSLNAPDHPSVLATDKQGNFYVGGTFTGTLYAGNSTIYNQSGSHDGFIAKFGSANCNCTVPTAHYTHGSLLSGANVSFTYDGSTPVDSVVWDFGDGEGGSGNSVSHSYTQDGAYTVCATAYNDCGSDMYCETLQVGDVGIGKIPGFADIAVYPNPATQTLTIEHAAAGTRLDIYNTLGRRMLHVLLQGNKDQVNVGNLAPGLYLMQFTDKDGRKGNARFVKQ